MLLYRFKLFVAAARPGRISASRGRQQATWRGDSPTVHCPGADITAMSSYDAEDSTTRPPSPSAHRASTGSRKRKDRNRRRSVTLLTVVAVTLSLAVASPADAKRPPRTTTTSPPATTTSTTAPASTTTTLASTTTTTVGATPTVSAPTGPPARICGNSTILNGPATQPVGSVRIDPGQDVGAATTAQPAATTFWLAPGTHSLGSSEYAQIIPKDNNVYIGAPGAVLDGRKINRYAFTQQATGVTIKHLTIKNFVPPLNEGVVNQTAATGWLIERNTITENQGAAIFMGNNVRIVSNCLTANSQYGFSGYKPAVAVGYGASALNNVVVDRNEISYNNTGDWETQIPGCGCTGGGKFWDVQGASVTNNWVHHNKSVGLWADTNNLNFLLQGNYIEENDHIGFWYEISYNFMIRANTFKRNGLVRGQANQALGDPFPIGGVYIAESGGDSRVSSLYATSEIANNRFEDNWDGVVLWEAAERFCNSPGNTSAGYCTKVNPQVTHQTCVEGNIKNEPYYSDCRWKTQNIKVHSNTFTLSSKTAIGCTGELCGRNAVFSNWGTSYPTWSPYLGTGIQELITYKRNNVFGANTYSGAWRFTPYHMGNRFTFSTWQTAPYNQDSGSTITGDGVSTATTTTAPTTTASTTTTTVPTANPEPVLTSNHLDGDTASLEGSTGSWTAWYSSTIARSTDQARAGSASLQINITAANGWGVTLNNWPGFAASPGSKTIGFWGRLGSGGSLGANLTTKWRDSAGRDLRVDTLSLAQITTSWQYVSAGVEAPPGTTTVYLELTSSSGVANDVLYIDDIFVG